MIDLLNPVTIWPPFQLSAPAAATGTPRAVWTEPARGLVWSEPARGILWIEPARSLLWRGPSVQTFVKRLGENNVPYAYEFAADPVIAGGDPIAELLGVEAMALGPDDAVPIDHDGGSYPGSGTRVNVVVGGGQDNALYQFAFSVLTAAGVTRVGLGRLQVQDDT